MGKIFGPKRQEVEDCKKMQNEELYNWYTSQRITSVITSKRLRWVRHMTRIRQTIKGTQDVVGET